MELGFSNIHIENHKKYYVERYFVAYYGIYLYYIAKARNCFWLDVFTSVKALLSRKPEIWHVG